MADFCPDTRPQAQRGCKDWRTFVLNSAFGPKDDALIGGLLS